MTVHGSEGVSRGIDGLDFGNEYSLTSHIDELSSLYTAHNAAGGSGLQEKGGQPASDDGMLHLGPHGAGGHQSAQGGHPLSAEQMHAMFGHPTDRQHPPPNTEINADARPDPDANPNAQPFAVPFMYDVQMRQRQENPQMPLMPDNMAYLYGARDTHHQGGYGQGPSQGSGGSGASSYGPSFTQIQSGFERRGGGGAPLESPAITPASVFSMGSASTNDFLSPISSPALNPQLDQQRQQEQFIDSVLSNAAANMGQYRAQSAGHASGSTTPVSPARTTPFPESRGTSSGSSPLTSADRTANQRRNRSVTAESKSSKVRPSPLVKPAPSPSGNSGNMATLSPRVGPRGGSKGSSQLRNAHTSPSLGALESLSNTMQEASGFSMPSPALSPASMSSVSQAQSQRALSQARSRSKQRSLDAGDSTETDEGRRSSLSSEAVRSTGNIAQDSPSPIDLSRSGGDTSPNQTPVTPGLIMGIAHGGSPTQPGGYDEAGAGAGQGAAPKQTPDLYAQQGMQQPVSFNGRQGNVLYGQPSGLPGDVLESGGQFPTQAAAVSAVAASALSGAVNARGSPFYGQVSQPKPILPSGRSPVDRNAWMNLQRMGSGGLDQRRTSHKAAEQKRRDSLKHCFDELRGLLPGIAVDDAMPGGSVLGPDGTREDQLAEGFDPEALAQAAANTSSEEGLRPDICVLTPEQAREANRSVAKVLLLRHSNEYLVRLKRRIERRDAATQALSEEVVRLRAALSALQKGSSGATAAPQDEARAAATGNEDKGVKQETGSLDEPHAAQPAAEPAPKEQVPQGRIADGPKVINVP